MVCSELLSRPAWPSPLEIFANLPNVHDFQIFWVEWRTKQCKFQQLEMGDWNLFMACVCTYQWCIHCTDIAVGLNLIIVCHLGIQTASDSLVFIVDSNLCTSACVGCPLGRLAVLWPCFPLPRKYCWIRYSSSSSPGSSTMVGSDNTLDCHTIN